jgi:hypothetical protein
VPVADSGGRPGNGASLAGNYPCLTACGFSRAPASGEFLAFAVPLFGHCDSLVPALALLPSGVSWGGATML